jgi:hypothetical protein
MAGTIRTLNAPSIFVNGVEITADTVEITTRRFQNNKPTPDNSSTYRLYVADANTPVTITMTTEYTEEDVNVAANEGNNNAVIKFTLNGKIPNLGSRSYGSLSSSGKTIRNSSGPIRLYTNATGADNTVIRAKVFYQGKSSDTKTVTIRVMNTD